MRGKIKLMAILLGTLLVLQTPFLARAFTVSTWNYDVQDTDNTPGPGPWYADAKGRSGQPCNELLYVHIAWDSVYIYVRWDVNATVVQVRQVYYVLILDAVPPFVTPVATRLLQFEADENGIFAVTVRDASAPSPALWTGNTNDFDWTAITNGTGLIGRYPWTYVTGDGPADIWVIRADSHSGQAYQGLSSEVMDYIVVGGNPVPWFTDLTMTLLIATVLVAFYVKKRGALAAKLKA